MTTIPVHLRRRAAAALRLAPLECGCSDPFSPRHRDHDDDAESGGANCSRCASIGLERMAYLARHPDHDCLAGRVRRDWLTAS